MPVILSTPEECEAWLTAPIPEALELQRPLPDALLSVVATGAKQDGLTSQRAPPLAPEKASGLVSL